MNKTLEKQIKKSFCEALCDYKSAKDVDIFLSDFLTDSEYSTLVKRLAVAYWLRKGRSYTNIMENLKASSATIASVKNIIDTAGMQSILANMEAEEWANVWTKRIRKLVG